MRTIGRNNRCAGGKRLHQNIAEALFRRSQRKHLCATHDWKRILDVAEEMDLVADPERLRERLQRGTLISLPEDQKLGGTPPYHAGERTQECWIVFLRMEATDGNHPRQVGPYCRRKVQRCREPF